MVVLSRMYNVLSPSLSPPQGTQSNTSSMVVRSRVYNVLSHVKWRKVYANVLISSGVSKAGMQVGGSARRACDRGVGKAGMR